MPNGHVLVPRPKLEASDYRLLNFLHDLTSHPF